MASNYSWLYHIFFTTSQQYITIIPSDSSIIIDAAWTWTSGIKWMDGLTNGKMIHWFELIKDPCHDEFMSSPALETFQDNQIPCLVQYLYGIARLMG